MFGTVKLILVTFLVINQVTSDTNDEINDLKQQFKQMEGRVELKLVNLDAKLHGKSFIVDHNSPCGDWTAYKDELCFKFLDKFNKTETQKDDYCSEFVFVQTREDQQFFERFLKDSQISDNVLIGIIGINNSFKWLNGTGVKYTNWDKDRPLKNDTDFKCVEMSVNETNYGKWIDIKCGENKKYAVLCKRIQPWSEIRVRNEILKNKYNLEQVKANPVPIGFIYVQLWGQSEPKTLWPNTEWQNISPKYSGLFFRAEGGQSSAFGQTQEQQTQSFELYSYYTYENHPLESWMNVTEKADNYLYTGDYIGGTRYKVGIKFKHNLEEIRPQNQAIRIWQRIK